jgi:hypothetical protein
MKKWDVPNQISERGAIMKSRASSVARWHQRCTVANPTLLCALAKKKKCLLMSDVGNEQHVRPNVGRELSRMRLQIGQQQAALWAGREWWKKSEDASLQMGAHR